MDRKELQKKTRQSVAAMVGDGFPLMLVSQHRIRINWRAFELGFSRLRRPLDRGNVVDRLLANLLRELLLRFHCAC